MREDGPDGKPAIYWLGYKSQLLRCAPHHIRPEIGRSSATLLGDLQVAKDVVQKLRSRGVTRFADLTIKNRNTIRDVRQRGHSRARLRESRSPQKIGESAGSHMNHPWHVQKIWHKLKPALMIRDWSPLDLWTRFHFNIFNFRDLLQHYLPIPVHLDSPMSPTCHRTLLPGHSG